MIGATAPDRVRPKLHPARRPGYIAAVAVNAVMLWVANSLLDWGWPAFLTTDFDDLLPWVDASMAAAIAVNLLWTLADPPWFRHLGQIGLNLISLGVGIRSWQIFPFDFSDYWGGWETVARLVIAVAVVGLTIDTVTRIVALNPATRVRR